MSNSGAPLVGAEDLNNDQYDKYIGAKLILDEKFNNDVNLDTVIRRAADGYGAPNVQAHINPMMDVREFEVEL